MTVATQQNFTPLFVNWNTNSKIVLFEMATTYQLWFLDLIAREPHAYKITVIDSIHPVITSAHRDSGERRWWDAISKRILFQWNNCILMQNSHAIIRIQM